jgi:hypothetical protein
VEGIKGEGFGEWIILKKLSKRMALPYSGEGQGQVGRNLKSLDEMSGS